MVSRNVGGLPPINRQRISPQVTTSGVGVRSDYQERSNLFGGISDKTANLAQEIANEEAALKGTEEALKNPNQQPRAAFTQAERAKKEAYLIGSEQLLTSTSSQSFKRIADSVTQNGELKPDSYERYKTLADAEMKGMLEAAPAEIRPTLAMKMNDFSQGYGEEVLNKVNQYNTNIGIANFYESYTNFTGEAESAYARGNVELGNAAIKNAMVNVEGAWRMGWLSPEKYQGLKEGLKEGAIVGFYNNQYRQALRAGQGDAFLNNLALNRPDGMSDDQFKAVASSLSGVRSLFTQGQAKVKSGVYAALDELRIRGQLTEAQLQEVKDEGLITHAQYNRLLEKVIKEGAEERELDSKWNEIIEGNYKPASVADANKIYNRKLSLLPVEKKKQFQEFGIQQTQPNIYYAAREGAQFNVPLASLKQEFHRLITSGDVNQQIDAVKGYKALDNNLYVIKGMDAQSFSFLNDVARMEKQGATLEQAISRANKTNFEITAGEKDVIDEQFKINTKDWDKNQIWRKRAADALDVNEEDVPDTYLALMKQGVREYFNFDRDIDSAIDTVQKELSTTFSINKINGNNKPEYYPINQYYEQNGIPETVYMNDTIRSLEGIMEKITEDYAKNGVIIEKTDKKSKGLPVYRYKDRLVIPNVVNPGTAAPPDETGKTPLYAIQLTSAANGQADDALLNPINNRPYLLEPTDVSKISINDSERVLIENEERREKIKQIVKDIGGSNALNR